MEQTGPITFRLLEEADIPFGMELKNIAGWNQTPADWQAYRRYEPEGCFVAMYKGKPAGTVTTIDYAGRFGWVGMVLVHPARRRLGIGTALLRQGIAYLRRIGVETVKLDATPMGKKVYVPMGFCDEYELDRRQGAGVTTDAPHFPNISKGDLADLIRFDAEAFGASRARVVARLAAENPDLAYIARSQSGAPAGYIIARKGWEAYQIGPWVSNSASLAEELFARVLDRLAGMRIFLDVPHPNEHALQIVARYGFDIQRGFTRMYLGVNSHPGKPAWTYGTSGAEKG